MNITIQVLVLPDGRALLNVAGIQATCESWDDARKVIAAFMEQHKLTLTRFESRTIDVEI